MIIWRLLGFILLLGMLSACASPPAATTPQSGQGAPAAPQIQRTLVIIARGELPSLAAKPFVAFSGSLNPP